MEKYNPREIKFNGIQTVKNWRIKNYSISIDKQSFSEELERRSLQLLQTELPNITDNVYGVGFMIVHHGKGANFVLLDWWCNENELQHQVYYSTKYKPEDLKKQDCNAPIACIWDLVVINHERNAWVKNMMTEKPKMSYYLKNYIHGKY